jgi:hypothetical protein
MAEVDYPWICQWQKEEDLTGRKTATTVAIGLDWDRADMNDLLDNGIHDTQVG